MRKFHLIGAVSAVALAACGGPTASDAPAPAPAPVPAAAPTPILEYPTKNAYFGDLHIHTKNSFDAYAFGVRATPDDAYRFAKGETIRHDGGFDIVLDGPPLDFLAVTDHGEYLGIVPAMDDPENPLSQTETAKAAFGENAADAQTTFLRIGMSFVQGTPIPEINDTDYMASIWAETVAAAERHNNPGTFTTFAAYEFTAMRQIPNDGAPTASNLHRNVVFKGDAPDTIFSTLNSPNPEDLWAWMDGQRAAGRDVLAIPHNSNASNGDMFAGVTYDGQPLTKDWSDARIRNEPLVEVTQIKGTSETNPVLSPNDEWAGHEQYEYFIGSSARATINKGDFVRSAYGRGLELDAENGFNPYKFGLIGSSDTHIGAATLKEETHWGKFPSDGVPAGRFSIPPAGARDWNGAVAPAGGRVLTSQQYSASGLAGVWAYANTREALFDAMRAKETFGTSGPRMTARMWAGYGYSDDILTDPDLVLAAYAGGVPIGGELLGEDGRAPRFIAAAMQDPASAPLDRMQIVKVWLEGGVSKEHVFDVACSGGAPVDPITDRCPDNGASVDVATCKTTAGTGAPQLLALWSDPDFDAAQPASYYVRVLENPTCRWSTWDAVRNGTPPNPALPATLQERAWTSPIWYKP